MTARRPALPTAAEWAEYSRWCDDKNVFLAAAYAWSEITPLDFRHGDYLNAIYQAEMDKADAAREYSRWCDDCAGSALADEEHQAEAS